MKTKYKKKLTAKHKAWIQRYQNYFGMEAMYIDDYTSGESTWKEVMQLNYNWLEDWTHEGIRSLERLEP